MSIKTYPGTLHAHTDFSNLRLRDSINKVSSLIDYAIELGHSCVAITDHECLSSYIQVEEYYEKVKDKIKVIRGNEIYLTRNGLNANNFNKERGDDYYHFILLAKDAEGYKQLCELSTRAWLRSYVSRRLRRVPTYYKDLKDIVATNPGHLVASTACLGGQLPKFLLKYRDTQDQKYWDTAVNWCKYMVNIFGKDNFYLEMQPSNNKDQELVNLHICKLHDDLDIPIIITTDAHYLKKEDAIIHEKYLNSQDGDREVKAFYETTYMMGTEELESFFPYLTRPYLDEAYENINHIVSMCEDFSIKRPLRIPCLPWKSYNVRNTIEIEKYISYMPALENFVKSSYKEDNELVFAVIDGIMNHSDLQNKEAYEALNQCLEMTWISSEVNNARWSAYYLNLQKIIEECWNAGTIVGPARGSGGGFLLLYCLDIIQMNALREKTTMYPWRFLNPERVSVLDIDFDVSGLKRKNVLDHLRKTYGEDRVCNVLTLRTEKSKSAILTAARGLDMTPEEGQYLSSLVGAERGQLFTLKQMYYGDEENEMKPNATFVEEMNRHSQLWEMAQKIEGLICGAGIHAGGVVFNDEPFTETASLMRAPDGTVISGFELHDLEKCSLIKYDALSVEGMDRIQVCLELLIKYGFVKEEATLKDTYEKVIGIYNIERNDPSMWEKVWNHEIISLFQMEQSSGIQGIAATKPQNVDDLAALNSVIRLMAQEKGAETPIEKYARFRKNLDAWETEMIKAGLTEQERQLLHKELDASSGLCIAQEQFMMLVQIPEIGGFGLQWADRLRKSIAKKNPKEYEKLTAEFFENMKNKNLSVNLCNYVWNTLIAMNRGYGFNQAHTLGYSLVALQEMNLACKYPIIFWNTANLIVDSAGVQETEEGDEETLVVELEDEEVEEIVDIYEPEDWEEYDYEDLPDRTAKKKKKNKSIDFGKIAMAIGKFQTAGIKVLPPDINKSDFSFTPDVESNSIASGLRNITRISADLVERIIANRPYSSIEDFRSKVKVNKTQMFNLLKCGAFDCIYPDRMKAIKEFASSLADVKSNLTLANVPMLMKYGILEEAEEYTEIFMYNKFLRKHLTEDKNYIEMTPKALEYYCDRFDPDVLIGDGSLLPVKAWEKQYKKAIEPLGAFINENKEFLLEELNTALIKEQLEEYSNASLSRYEIESMSFYYHEHELKNMDRIKYDLVDFNSLPFEPEIERTFPAKDGNGEIKLYRLYHICGTVLDKNKMKGNVSLLTPDGVVNVKVWKNQFAKYDKQISEVGLDGKKHVMERSWFQRGNLLYIQGIRRGDSFIPKTYKGSLHRIPIMKITKINGKDIEFTNLRYDEA